MLEDAGFILSEAYVRKVMVQLFEALEALHELDVAHLDIKVGKNDCFIELNSEKARPFY